MVISNTVFYSSSASMQQIPDSTADLILTSPPYPMIEMWDRAFSAWNPEISDAITGGCPENAFELMHSCLDTVWMECARILKPGGFACINIGDAARTVNNNFRLYSNHARIIQSFLDLNFQTIPHILWRKQTNAPNKFMGSGMLPSGAYVTLEHEYILIFRKGGKRAFGPEEAGKRRESAFFWEERNRWFSDLWDFKGIRQGLLPGRGRERSGAFPLELAHRLISMYSLKGDTVADPFLGTGTSLAAAIINGRQCVGCEIDSDLREIVKQKALSSIDGAEELIRTRLEEHIRFIADYSDKKGAPKYRNTFYDIPVITRQEQELKFGIPRSAVITRDDESTLEMQITYEHFHMT